MAVVRPLEQDVQAGEHHVLAGVNTDDEQVRPDAVVPRGVAGEGHIHAAAALDGPDTPVGPVFAEPQHLVREVAAAVHAGCQQIKHGAVLLPPAPGQELVQVCPYLPALEVAVDFLVADAPAFLADAPAHHLDLEAVVLGVHAGGQVDHAVRHLGLVVLPALEEQHWLRRVALFLPGQAQVGVDPDLNLLVVAPLGVLVGFYVALDDARPVAQGAAQRVHVEAAHLPFGMGCHPPAPDALLLPAVLFVYAAAFLAAVLCAARRPVLGVVDHIVPDKGLIVAAVGARQLPLFLGRKLVFFPDTAGGLVGGGAGQHRLVVPEGRLPLLGQLERIALLAGAGRVGVHLVRQQNLDGPPTQVGGGVGPNDG